jgi:hypothetical protein
LIVIGDREAHAVAMLRNQIFPIDKIYVPTARRTTIDPAKVEAIAEDWLTNGQKTPIQVRADGERFVLVEGLHRLEAAKKLGETKIVGLLVQARRH